ncbi:hypothetical protein Tco_1095144, partial [Tanacetum coccineum]
TSLDLLLLLWKARIPFEGDSWNLWSVAMQGGGCCGGFGYKEMIMGLLEALGLQRGDGGACKLLRWQLGES